MRSAGRALGSNRHCLSARKTSPIGRHRRWKELVAMPQSTISMKTVQPPSASIASVLASGPRADDALREQTFGRASVEPSIVMSQPSKEQATATKGWRTLRPSSSAVVA
ncbi:hypothetical protein LIA77_11727 [Sarocladium implicatum]|nr:hypothetical protein LIA77_11727 [Sarocladium implicatum]